MKNPLKIALKVLGFTSCLILFALIIILLWFKNEWPRYIDKEQILKYSEAINNSDSIPENFYKVYDKIYSYRRHTRIVKSYTIGFIQAVLTSKTNPDIISPALLLSQSSYWSFVKTQKGKIPWTFSIYFSFALDEYTTPEKCFDYYLNNYDFLYNQIGIGKASLWYYNKPTTNLSEREIVGLIVMLENPVAFNPIRAPEAHEKKVNKLINSK